MKKGMRIKSDNPTVGIVGLSAPEAFWFPEFYEKGKKEIENRGLTVVEGSTVHSHYFYMSGEPEKIALGLHEMFLRKDVDMIMCAGGGLTMNKVLPYIDFELLANNFKPFVGVSNIVVLMAAMLQNNMVTFHGPFSIWSYGTEGTPTDYTHNNMMRILKGYKGELTGISEWKTFHRGESKGVLIGGNITSLDSVVGTRFCPVELFDGKILMLEDIGETFDELDAVLTHMELLGIFDRISGVIIGKMTDCNAPENVEMNEVDFLNLVFGKYKFPIIYDCDFGHVPNNLCLPIGCKAHIKAKEKPEIILLESGVD